jgi:uncharacterized membrane-anchored protein
MAEIRWIGPSPSRIPCSLLFFFSLLPLFFFFFFYYYYYYKKKRLEGDRSIHGWCWLLLIVTLFVLENYSIHETMAVFSSTNKTLCRKKIPRHIKLAIYAWSTKCR